jgi:16S rRNA (guanine1516-N2)-methyltransferase
LARAETLANRLNLVLAKTEGLDSIYPYALHVTEERIELVATQNIPNSRIFAEFLSGPVAYRRQKGGGKNQAIGRAVGLKGSKGPLTILDATAGLGRDAFVLVTLGCSVHLVERSPVIATLLSDGLSRAAQSSEIAPIIDLMRVTIGDAEKVLENLRVENYPDVVYLDPMFPSQNKSALAKIEMRIIRNIVGDDQDAPQLLAVALEKAKKRVVVKRPRHAKPLALASIFPSFLVEGKSNRYDVYLTGGSN